MPAGNSPDTGFVKNSKARCSGMHVLPKINGYEHEEDSSSWSY